MLGVYDVAVPVVCEHRHADDGPGIARDLFEQLHARSLYFVTAYGPADAVPVLRDIVGDKGIGQGAHPQLRLADRAPDGRATPRSDRGAEQAVARFRHPAAVAGGLRRRFGRRQHRTGVEREGQIGAEQRYTRQSRPNYDSLCTAKRIGKMTWWVQGGWGRK